MHKNVNGIADFSFFVQTSNMESKESEKKRLQVVVRIRPQQKPDNVWVTVADNKRLRTINHRNIDEALEYE